MRKTMLLNIFCLVLISLVHGNPVPSWNCSHDPEDKYCKQMCVDYPEMNHCGYLRKLAESDPPAYLLKVEGGTEYLVEMEPRVEDQVTSQSQSLLDE